MFSSADRVEMLGLGLGDVVPEVDGLDELVGEELMLGVGNGCVPSRLDTSTTSGAPTPRVTTTVLPRLDA